MSLAPFTIDFEITDRELAAISCEFENKPPQAALRWAIAEFGHDMALATGFGAEGCVLIDMVSRISNDVRIFYLDTDLLFPETYALCSQLEARYGIRLERRSSRLSLEQQAQAFGDRLWERQPDLCCRLRKVEPLQEVLMGLRAWITAIRRDQTASRGSANIVERDLKFSLIKINPLATWSSSDVWHYIDTHDVPHNPLYKHGYTSIGCVPCTTPVQIGEDPRAGRWRGSCKTECGLHQ